MVSEFGKLKRMRWGGRGVIFERDKERKKKRGGKKGKRREGKKRGGRVIEYGYGMR